MIASLAQETGVCRRTKSQKSEPTKIFLSKLTHFVCISSLQNNDLNVNIQWSPPEFISGEIAKYGIEIKAVNNTWNISKDIETKDLQKISQQSQHQRPKYTYSTGPLEYGTLYNVTVFAVTTYGHKGNLAKALVQTVQIEKDIMQDQPYLYFARGVELYRKKIDLAMPFERDELVYQFKSTLQAMDTFSADNLLFVGDDNGLLYRFNCDKNSIEKEVKSPLRNILAISVDWLYKNVYISSDSQVYRCTFGKTDFQTDTIKKLQYVLFSCRIEVQFDRNCC